MRPSALPGVCDSGSRVSLNIHLPSRCRPRHPGRRAGMFPVRGKPEVFGAVVEPGMEPRNPGPSRAEPHGSVTDAPRHRVALSATFTAR